MKAFGLLSPLFGLAPGGACHASGVAVRAVRSYRTLSPLPRKRARRFTFCGAFPGVAPAGHYPAPCLRGARTFLSLAAAVIRPGSVWRRGVAPVPRDDHSSGTTVTGRLMRPTRATARRRDEGLRLLSPLFGLAPGGACHASRVAARAVRSYRTLSPLPRESLSNLQRRFAFCGAFPGVAPAGEFLKSTWRSCDPHAMSDTGTFRMTHDTLFVS
jgi:diadenosine tetraphosphatase ApaH/serine/threonine PP2A family protein phosphatase